MKTVWHRSAGAALMAVSGAPKSWAEGTAATPLSEPAAAAGTWGGVGLWAIIAAAVILGALVVGRFLRSSSGAQPMPDGAQQRGAIAGAQTSTPRGYSAQNVGNDASARPWERSGPSLDAGTAAGSQGGVVWGSNFTAMPLPAGFDAAHFLQASKANFVALQDAWDRSDMACLRAMMTDGMLDQIKGQLAEREQFEGRPAPVATEVVMLDAHLLGVEEQDDVYMASVEFSGMLREDPSAGPNPFRELWNISRPKTEDGGWRVAGVQALQ